MAPWIGFALLSFVFWGLWGFFSKVALGYMDAKSVFLYEILTGAIISLAFLLVGFRPEFHPKGVLFAVLTGVGLGLGHIFFYLAAERGKISVVIALTSLYPLITIILAILLLREQLTWFQAGGVLSALVAMTLFSL